MKHNENKQEEKGEQEQKQNFRRAKERNRTFNMKERGEKEFYLRL